MTQPFRKRPDTAKTDPDQPEARAKKLRRTSSVARKRQQFKTGMGWSPQAVERGGVSLSGQEGADVLANIDRLMMGNLSLRELGDPRYGRDPDGTLRVLLDDASFASLDEDAPPPTE